MEDLLRQMQEVEENAREKDMEIERLEREKHEYMAKVKELEAELVSLRKLATLTWSSTLEKKEPPTVLNAQLPARPSPHERIHQPNSILADLPARPAFTGFDTPSSTPASRPSSFAPTASSQMFHPLPTPYFGGMEPPVESSTPPTHATRSERRPKGTIPPLLPHHRSFGASQMQSPVTGPQAMFQNLGTPNPSQYATGAPASITTPDARAKPYFHGPSTRHTHLPTLSPSRTVSPIVPASPISTLQKGKQPLSIY